jgi:tetratricopeptide (TPR) repeat protein
VPGAAPGAAVQGPPVSAPAELPLSGRDAETAALTDAWARRRVMLLQGEGGIGKTRLATSFAAAQGAYALAQCRAGDAASPYAAFKRTLRLLAGAALDAVGLPAWIAAELAHLLPELGTPGPRAATAEDRSRLHEAALAAWQHLAAGSFDAVIIDDWHLADDDSRQLFNALALAPSSPEAPRWMFLLRPDLDAAGHDALTALVGAGALHLRLAPLDEAALLALVQQLSGAPTPHRFTRRLLAATGGNPFFVAETLAHWQGLGLLARDDGGRWRTPFDEGTDDYRELPLPASVREAVLARVRRQPDAVQRLLQAAALAAEPFGPGLLAGACGLSETETLAALEQGLEAGLLRELGDGHAFAHDLVQAAVASLLPPERARLVHRRLALAAEAAGLDEAEIARHWERGGEPRRAVPWRLAAAERAGALGSWPAADAHWAAALADDPTPEQHLLLLRKRWPTLQARDDRPALQQLLDELQRLHERWRQHPSSARAAVQARVEQALILSLELRLASERSALDLADEVQPALAPDDPLQPELALARAQALNNQQRHDEAQQIVEAALKLPGVDLGMQAKLMHTLVFGLFQLGQPQRALPYAQRVVSIRRAQGDRRAHLRALANLGLVHSAIGDQGAARAAMEEALQIARALHALDPQRELSNNLADIHLTEGRPAQALALVDQALALSPHWSRPRLRVFLLGMRVQALWQLGALGQARAAADLALAAASEPDLVDANPLVDALSMQLDLFGFVGDFAEAQRRLALLAAHPGARSPHFEVKLAFNRVHLAVEAGDLPAARAAMADIGDPLALHEQRDREHAVLCAAELALAEGDAAGACRWLDAHPAPQAHVEVAARRAWLRLQAAAPDDEPARQAAAAAAADARTPRPIALGLAQSLAQSLARAGAATDGTAPGAWAAAAATLRHQLLDSLAGAASWQATLAARWPVSGARGLADALTS